MRGNRLSLSATLIILVVAVFAISVGAVAQDKVLHSFGGSGDGITPIGNIVFDAAGNIYGTTSSGGAVFAGTVFELKQRGDGTWVGEVLHSFGEGTDGASPAAGLMMDANGNLYGTTQNGGLHGYGTVFEMERLQGGGWKEKLLHSFPFSETQAMNPESGLVMDAAGNLYGTSYNGGIHGYGTAYELSPNSDGGWTERVIHSFNDDGHDGSQPKSGLVFDAQGNLYGAAYQGGIHYFGAVFELLPRGDGAWDEKVIHSFGNGTDGTTPRSELIFDAGGNLYGTTYYGGIHQLGTAYELSPRGGGSWTERVLHSFNGGDGQYPQAALLLDSNGNLFGTTRLGGIHNEGTIFELSPEENGEWTRTILHSFNSSNDAAGPAGAMIPDSNGNLYGTTEGGGIRASGAAYEITP